MSKAAQAMAPGFADPVFDGQAAFRAVMDATARPGLIVDLGKTLSPPSGLMPAAAAAILALCDFETNLWLSPALREHAGDYLRFHTNAPAIDHPHHAAFALLDLACDPLRLAGFAQGEAEYPDRSTTVIVQTRSLREGPCLQIAGPGIASTSELRASELPDDFAAQWSANKSAFPLGVDLLFVSGHELLALPRTTRLLPGGI